MRAAAGFHRPVDHHRLTRGACSRLQPWKPTARARSSRVAGDDRQQRRGPHRTGHRAGPISRRPRAARPRLRSARRTSRFKVKPQVTPDGNIIMTLDINRTRWARAPTPVSPSIPSTSRPSAGGERRHGGDRGIIPRLADHDHQGAVLRDLPFLGSFSATTPARTTRPSSWCSSPRASLEQRIISQR